MKIYLGSDHAGFELKEIIKVYLASKKYDVEDLGAIKYNAEDDYPDFVRPVALAVAKSDGRDRGLVFGGSGQGEAMMANRIKGIRATVFYGGPMKIIDLSREHNNANVLAFGARFVTEGEAIMAVEFWLRTGFAGGRHIRRVDKIDQ
jgi:ribose 5-phosphate isomerase B